MADNKEYSLIDLETLSTPGVYISWERPTSYPVAFYQVQRSNHLSGPYVTVATLAWPKNEYIDYADTGARPECYYRIVEVGLDGKPLLTGQPTVGEELLLKQTLAYEVMAFMNKTLYDEEAQIFGKNRTYAQFPFKNWNPLPDPPQVRITGASEDGDSMILLSEDEGIRRTAGDTDNYPNGLRVKFDWQGKVYFIDDAGEPVSLQSYDSILVTYSCRLFTHRELNDALYQALQSINSFPGTNKYPMVGNAPFYYDPALIAGAAYFLFRRLIASLHEPEKRMRLSPPDKDGPDILTSLRETANMYKESFDKLAENLAKSRYPTIKSIVTPEYQLPGGRSAYFRMAFKGF